jgi:hypothetical protein
MSTQQDAAIINAERQRMAARMTEQLHKMGVEVHVAHYTGDSSFPTEYTITFQGISEVGPTFDMALMGWLAKLIEYCTQPASAYEAMETALKLLSGNTSNMRTELLMVKAMVADLSEKQGHPL